MSEPSCLATRSCGGARLRVDNALEKDRWDTAGAFADIDAFTATLTYRETKFSLEQRQALNKQLARIGASQRASGRLLAWTRRRSRGILANGRAKR